AAGGASGGLGGERGSGWVGDAGSGAGGDSMNSSTSPGREDDAAGASDAFGATCVFSAVLLGATCMVSAAPFCSYFARVIASRTLVPDTCSPDSARSMISATASA